MEPMVIPSCRQARTLVSLRRPRHHTTVKAVPPSSARLSLRMLCRECRRIPLPRIIKIHEFLACHVGIEGEVSEGYDFSSHVLLLVYLACYMLSMLGGI